MQLTNLQSEKVQEIVACYGEYREVQFKAPTGSGKTLMATNVIAQLINNNPTENFIFVVATVSTSSLPQAFEQKINEYKTDLPVNNFEVEYIESPSNNKNNKSDAVPQIRVVRNKVYIFGKATFGKSRIFTEQSVITDFIQDCKTHNYKIIYIRDEAHIGTQLSRNDEGVGTFEKLMNDSADFILKMTATFGNGPAFKRIELKEKDLRDPAKNQNRWLMKFTPEQLADDTESDEELLDKAIEKFKEIQNDYQKLDIQIKPAMLIQVDNEPTDLEQKEIFKNTLQMIKDKLSQNGLSWVQYFGDSDKAWSNVDNDNFTLSKITRNNDPTDCIIFKIGPATGWDIPRACMLLQLRNVCSANLNIQTIGRIRRNPYPGLERNSVTDKYYIFSNAPQGGEDYVLYDYKVKDVFKGEELAVIKMVKKGSSKPNKDKQNKAVAKFLTNKKNELIQIVNSRFENDKYSKIDKKTNITNPILLLKRIKVLYDNLKSEIRKVVDIVEEQYSQSPFKDIKWEQLEIVLLEDYIKNLTDIYRTCVPMTVTYKVELETIKPDTYTELFESTSKNMISVEGDTSYIFQMYKDGQFNTEQQLDSSNETIVASVLKNYFQLIPAKAWAKNRTTGSIFGEYLDETNSDRRSYFDFVIKFKNGTYLYLEVKGDEDNDIDYKKTELLQRAYTDYFENITYELFKPKLVICLIRVTHGDPVIAGCFYDKQLIQTKLEELNLAQLVSELAK